VLPRSEHIGAEIRDLTLKEMTPLATTTLRSALLRHKVVVVKGQHLSHTQHVAVAEALGEVTIAHISLGGIPGHPAVFSLRRTAGKPNSLATEFTRAAAPAALTATESTQSGTNDASRGFQGWHTDITASLNPPAVSILRAQTVPSMNADTRWTNLAVAYKTLPEDLKHRIQGLRGVHYPSSTWPGPHARNRSKTARVGEQTVNIVSEHPLVTIHPETGEKVLNCSASFLKHIKDLSPGESDDLLLRLWRHATQAEFTFAHAWSAGDVVFWDNRATMHLAPTGLPPVGEERLMFRVTTRGQPFVGADGSTSTAVSGRPILEVSQELAVGLWAGMDIIDRDSDEAKALSAEHVQAAKL
jgi:taurine dioxygenase